MVTVKKAYYHACGGGKVLSLQKDDLITGAKPLVWFNNGLWGAFSEEKVANVIRNLYDQEKLPVLDRKKDVGKFYWDDCELVPAKLAKLLFGEKK